MLELEPAAASEPVIAVKDIDPRHRHTIVQQLFAHLTPGPVFNSSLITIRSRCASSLKRNTVRSANGPIWRKVRTSGVCGFNIERAQETENIRIVDDAIERFPSNRRFGGRHALR